MRPLRRFASVPLVLLVVAACADDPTAVESPRPDVRSAVTTVDPDGPPLVPNGVPYRNPDYEHATGRSGGANLTARALLGRDGMTTLDVTTGELDGASPPHDITKLQVKLLPEADRSGNDPDEVLNYNRVGAGSATYEYFGRARHSFIQVQGNITVPNAGGGRMRTGVVTLRERVNLRPDLAASGLSVPQTAHVDEPVDVSAVITELNGDLGATADCLLYVDGSEVDRAQGIWVAEGDAVTCMFTHSFATTGEKALRVAAENVVPGDWDEANNAVTGTIEIVDPAVPLRGRATAREQHLRRTEHARGVQGGFFPTRQWDYTRTYTNDLQSIDIRRATAASEGLTLPVTFEFSIASDGETLLDLTVESTINRDFFGRTCGTARVGAPGERFWFLEACNDDWFRSVVQVTARTVAGVAAYRSEGYDRFRSGFLGEWQYRDLDFESDRGPLDEWGSQLEIRLAVTGGARYAADVVVPLAPYEISFSRPERCHTSFLDFNCLEVLSHEETGLSGSASF